MNLKHKQVLITGGAKGIGLATAKRILNEGANVIIWDFKEDDLLQTVRDLKEQGHNVFSQICDVTNKEQVYQNAAIIKEKFGSIDVLINNAGINIRGPIDELSFEDFQQVMDVNVNGVWRMARAVVPHMKKVGYGRIVNLASTLGLVGLSNRTPYTSSKGAVAQMTRALGLELAEFGITCNAICPGPFLTPMNVPIKDDEQTKKFIVGAVALERWGEMEEIQGAAIFLSSNASSYMTGSMLVVDGGWTAR